jgi:hypothetical protein
MNLNFVWNWKDILAAAWSVKVTALAAFLGIAQQMMALVPSGLVGLSPETWGAFGTVVGALGIFCSALVVPVRLIDQGLAKS